MRLSRDYCLHQASWWQRQAAIEHEVVYYELAMYLKYGCWKNKEGRLAQAQRRHRIAHQTSRDYLDVAEYLLRIETAVDSVNA